MLNYNKKYIDHTQWSKWLKISGEMPNFKHISWLYTKGGRCKFNHIETVFMPYNFVNPKIYRDQLVKVGISNF